MILYKKEDESNNMGISHKTIIDLKISKNRNGQTGECKLEFIPQTSTFSNANQN